MTKTLTLSRGGGGLRWVGLLLAMIGFAVCLVLLRMSVGATPGGDAFSAAVCSPSRRINCDYVLSSPWAKIGPLPAAAVGLAYFGTLAAWFAIVGTPNTGGSRWRLVPIAITFVGLVASAYYMYIMAMYLPVWCTWCIAAHGINAALFVTALCIRPMPLSERGVNADFPASSEDTAFATNEVAVGPHPTTARAIGVLGASIALSLLSAFAVFGYQMQLTSRHFQLALLEATNNPEYILMRWRSQMPREIDLRAEELSIGPADAPHALIVYTDFECEKCAWFHPYVDRMVKMFPEKLRIIWRHYPISPECNARVTQAFHYYACEAAAAAEAARRVGQPSQAIHFHGLLYRNARMLASRPYEAIAAESGLDVNRFTMAMMSEEVRRRVTEDIDSAARLDVTATPAFFLNGRRLPTWHITTDEVRPRIDVGATDELWRRLIAAASEE